VEVGIGIAVVVGLALIGAALYSLRSKPKSVDIAPDIQPVAIEDLPPAEPTPPTDVPGVRAMPAVRSELPLVPTLPEVDLQNLPARSGFVPERTVPDPPRPKVDWMGELIIAAKAVAASQNTQPMEQFQRRFEQVVPCPDPDLRDIFDEERTGDFLRYLAVQSEEKDPPHALALATAASLLDPESAEVVGSAALIAIGNFDEGLARKHTARLREISPKHAEIVEPSLAQIFTPADAPVDFHAGEAPIQIDPIELVRDVESIKAALGEIHAQLLHHRQVLLEAGAPEDAPWLPSPPDSWKGFDIPTEPGDPVEHAKDAGRQWAAARVLCAAVGWPDLQPQQTVEPVDLTRWTAWAEYQLWFARDVAATGGMGSLMDDSLPEVEWRGSRLAGLSPPMATAVADELLEVLAMLRWLTDSEASSPFDSRLRRT